MIRLNRFLINPFDDPEISLDELLAFSTDHLQRLIANNSAAVYTTRITATTTALNLVSSTVTDDTVKMGLRKGRKLAKDNFRKVLPGNVEKLYAVVVAKFGSAAPEVLDCFPEGRKVFSDSTDDHLEYHLSGLKTALLAKQAALGASGVAVVADADALLQAWIALHNSSETATGNKTNTEAAKKAARWGLQLQLGLNLLEIAKNNFRDETKLDLYMKQYLLEDPASPPPPPVPPGP